MESDLLGKREAVAEEAVVAAEAEAAAAEADRLTDRSLLALRPAEKSSPSESDDKSELLLRHSLNIDRSCKGPRRELLPALGCIFLEARKQLYERLSVRSSLGWFVGPSVPLL